MFIRRQGDVSRRRRLVGPPAKVAWYAACRARRFAHSDFRQHHHGQPPDSAAPSHTFPRCA
jgi:hypothetical protein